MLVNILIKIVVNDQESLHIFKILRDAVCVGRSLQYWFYYKVLSTTLRECTFLRLEIVNKHLRPTNGSKTELYVVR